MSDLGFNKIAAAVLMTGLVAIGLNELSHQFFHEAHHDEPGYKVEVAEEPAPGEDAAAPEGPRDYYTFLTTADAAAGEAVAAKCKQCHNFEKGAAALQGPALWGVVGRDVASVAGFDYSAGDQGMSAVEGVWDYARLDKFIERPKAYIPGTSMNFVGVRRERDRADLIAYLRTLADPGMEMAMPEPMPAAPVDASLPADGAAPGTEGAPQPVDAAPATPTTEGAPAVQPTSAPTEGTVPAATPN